MDVASISSTHARTAQSHAQAVASGRANANQAIAEAGQKQFERTQTVVGSKLGKSVDLLA